MEAPTAVNDPFIVEPSTVPVVAVDSDHVHVVWQRVVDKDDLFYNQAAIIPGTPGTWTTLSAAPTLVSNGGQIRVTMTLSATDVVNGVTASDPIVLSATSGGASASCGSPVLTSADDDISGPSDSVSFQYTCTATAGANPGSVTFQASGTGTDGDGNPTTFDTATSNSVLVAHPSPSR